MAYRNYSTAVSHIVDATGQGDFTTITAAYAAAVAGQTIFVRPGQYTENPVAKARVSLTAFECDSTSPNVIINGNLSYSGSGVIDISGICLQTNSNFALSVTGSSGSVVIFNNCRIVCSNNTGISFTNSNASSQISFNNCSGDFTSSTSVSLYSSSSPGVLTFNDCGFSNSVSTTGVSSNSAGIVDISYSVFSSPISCTSTGGLGILYSIIESGQNITSITFNGTGTNTFYQSTTFGGSSPAVSIGTGAFVIVNGCTLQSSNTNAIAGSGSVGIGFVTYTQSTGIENTLTVTYAPLQAGNIIGGSSTLTGILLGNGISSITAISNGTSGQVLTSNGSSSPTFQAAGASLIGYTNNSGTYNTALGFNSFASISGSYNVSVGALNGQSTTIGGSYNCCLGVNCMDSSASGNQNVAMGYGCLYTQSSGSNNTAVGGQSLLSSSGASNNTCLGFDSGGNYTGAESNNICIGANVGGTVSESNAIHIGDDGTRTTCTIGGISGVTVVGAAVLCSTAGKLGTVVSSERFKEQIEDISENEFIELRPVSFKYKGDIDQRTHYGMIAEEVHKIFPSLVVYDHEGRPNSVSYHEMSALLLKEIQRLDRRFRDLEKKLYS